MLAAPVLLLSESKKKKHASNVHLFVWIHSLGPLNFLASLKKKMYNWL